MNDADVRRRARFIADQLVRAQRTILERRTDRDGNWDVPGDLADYGDGTGLMGVIDHQLVGEMRAALERAEADLRALRVAVEDDKRRRIGPGYRPHTAA